MSDTRVIVFAKAPVPGTVKTRLAPRFGADGAAALHVELVERALDVACAAAIGPVELCCAPDAGHPFFAEAAARHGIDLAVQGAGDLGARMHRALARSIARGASRAVLIGTDCPAMSPTYLASAAAALGDAAPVVLGPAEDGGYVLVGARDRVPEVLFDRIAWGTADVLATTRLRLADAGLAWHELPTLWDVDHPADVDRWRALPMQDAR
jgi:rSAM/selenodomain-associated transferase 1